MKLSKLYTNQPKLFTPISFYDGFNVILGEVKTTLDKDTHNLGKSLLVSIIDFCFLRKKESFPLIHVAQLQDFVFYLEIKITENKFVTVARSISNPTKVCFKYHYKADQDFRGLLENEWDKYNLAFAAAKNLLDGLLNLQFLGDNSYRRFISYLLRNQTDFNDPFRLSSKNRGKDIDWKPNLARLLGFNEQLLISLYEKKEQLKKLKEKQKEIEKEAEALSNVKTLSDVEGEINVIKSRIENIETQLEVLNFGEQEKQTIAELVDLLNDRIATLNDELFYAENSEKRITKSLEEDNIIFNPDEAAHLFKEAGVIFEGQIKKEFSDLIQFHRSISEERKFYIRSADFSLEILDIGASNSENTEIENKISNGLEIQEENNNKTKELWKNKIGEIEITRFITRIGAELRNDYNSFRDLRRDFNLLELINIKYSSKHELGTLHPKILKLFGKEASKKENLDIYDVNFYVNCLNGSVERDAIIAYINLKLQMEQENYTNEELYQYLVKILDNLGKDRKITEKKRVIPRKITIE